MPQPIYGKLYQFSEMSGRMSMPVHQYLLATDPAIMFATGTASQADWILPQVETILGGRPLKYLLVSHMESDECGGYRLFQRKYPKMQIIASPFTARELQGFGHRGRIIIGDDTGSINDGELSLKFIRYPSEVHLQYGILCLDRGSGVFYSSDLFFHDIKQEGAVIEADWKKEISGIYDSLIPNEKMHANLLKDLEDISPRFVATGHGSCIRCSGASQP